MGSPNNFYKAIVRHKPFSAELYGTTSYLIYQTVYSVFDCQIDCGKDLPIFSWTLKYPAFISNTYPPNHFFDIDIDSINYDNYLCSYSMVIKWEFSIAITSCVDLTLKQTGFDRYSYSIDCQSHKLDCHHRLGMLTSMSMRHKILYVFCCWSWENGCSHLNSNVTCFLFHQDLLFF